MEAIKNERGQVIGYKTNESNGSTYYAPGGKLVSRVRNGTTYNEKSQTIGNGDQALRLFGKK
jgi:hypothetical protein